MRGKPLLDLSELTWYCTQCKDFVIENFICFACNKETVWERDEIYIADRWLKLNRVQRDMAECTATLSFKHQQIDFIPLLQTYEKSTESVILISITSQLYRLNGLISKFEPKFDKGTHNTDIEYSTEIKIEYSEITAYDPSRPF
mgnify:CR=1 FL=1